MADVFAKETIENNNTVTELFQLKIVYFMLRRKMKVKMAVLFLRMTQEKQRM